MKRKLIALAFLLLLAVASIGRPGHPGRDCRGLDKRAAALIRQYRELRERGRRLPQGTFDHDLQGHGGKLHNVLSSLGKKLGRRPYTKQMIVKCMGEPDEVKTKMGDLLFFYRSNLMYEGREVKEGWKLKEGRNREYLIYHWRGGHDFMFFISEGGRIIDHGWWHALE